MAGLIGPTIVEQHGAGGCGGSCRTVQWGHERRLRCCAAEGLADVESRLQVARIRSWNEGRWPISIAIERRSAARRAMTSSGLRSGATWHITRARSCWYSGISAWMAGTHSDRDASRG